MKSGVDGPFRRPLPPKGTCYKLAQEKCRLNHRSMYTVMMQTFIAHCSSQIPAERIRVSGKSVQRSRRSLRDLCLVSLFCLMALPVFAQTPLSNDGILQMVGVGINDEIVIALINSQQGKYVLTPDSIVGLHKGHVSDRVILAMIAKGVSGAPEVGPQAKQTSSPSANEARKAKQKPGDPSPPQSTETQQKSVDLPTTVAGKAKQQAGDPTADHVQAKQTNAVNSPTVRVQDTSNSNSNTASKPADDTYHGFSVGDLTSAFIGTGWLLTANGTDYKILQSSNVIESTGLGHKTPDFLFGAAFNTTLRPRFWKGSIKRLNDPHLDGFVSLKFTPGSQNAINGLVFGGAVRIHPNLDIVVGVALTPQNAPSIGIRNAAYLAALSDPTYYAGFTPKDLLLNKQQAFDGFPLMTRAGKQLYAGDPLTTQYRNGLFVGISFPISLSGLFRATTTTPSTSTVETTDDTGKTDDTPKKASK